MNLVEFQWSDIIADTFVRTADENYVVARWTLQNGLWNSFSWSAAHAVEKYVKASLLLNGLNAKRLGHLGDNLFEKLNDLAGNLLPQTLVSRTDPPRSKDTRDFIRYLADLGSPNARYGLYGSSAGMQDLILLDQLVYSLRRILWPLDSEVYGIRTFDDEVVPTYRQWLLDNPDDAVSNRPFCDLLEGDRSGELERALFNCNLAFAPHGYEHDWSRLKAGWRKSAIEIHIADAVNSKDDEWVAQGVALAKRLDRNVKLAHKDHDWLKRVASFNRES